MTIPYRVTAGGEAGVDYSAYIDTDFVQHGRNWANWILEVLPEGGNVLMLSGPPATARAPSKPRGR